MTEEIKRTRKVIVAPSAYSKRAGIRAVIEAAAVSSPLQELLHASTKRRTRLSQSKNERIGKMPSPSVQTNMTTV